MATRDRIRHFSRYTIFTKRDEIAFFRALESSFPRVEFAAWPGRGAPPAFKPDVEEAFQSSVGCFIAVSSEGSQTSSELQGPDECQAIVWLIYRRGHWETGDRSPERKWAFDWPTLTYGDLYASYDDDSILQKANVKRCFRQLRHVARRCPDARSFWLGHDACRWALEKPRRMLDGSITVPPDWTFPKSNPLYDGLDSIPRGDDTVAI